MLDSLWPHGAHKASLSRGFCRQECWNELPFPSPGKSSQSRDQIHVSCLAGRFFTTVLPEYPTIYMQIWSKMSCPHSSCPDFKRTVSSEAPAFQVQVSPLCFLMGKKDANIPHTEIVMDCETKCCLPRSDSLPVTSCLSRNPGLPFIHLRIL